MNPRPFLSIFPPSVQTNLFYRFLNPRQKLFSRCFPEANLKLAPGFKMVDLVIGDVISGSIALSGFYEYELSTEILKASRKGGLMVDVGANMGYFTLLWLHGNPENRVIAIEASERNVALLRKNIEVNGVADRVDIWSVAAGDRNGTVKFCTGPEDQTGWGSVSDQGEEIEMRRIDSAVDERIEVMKIDVEGADGLVILGCEKLLDRRLIQEIHFEITPGVDIQPATDILVGNGYRVDLQARSGHAILSD